MAFHSHLDWLSSNGMKFQSSITENVPINQKGNLKLNHARNEVIPQQQIGITYCSAVNTLQPKAIDIRHRDNNLKQFAPLFRASFVDSHWNFSHDTLVIPTPNIDLVPWVLVTEHKSVSFSGLHSCTPSESANPRIPHVINEIDCTVRSKHGVCLADGTDMASATIVTNAHVIDIVAG